MKFSLNSVIDGATKVGGWLGRQKHFASIRDAFASLLPFMIVGAFAVMIDTVFVSNTGLIADLTGNTDNAVWVQFSSYVSPIFTLISGATLNLLGMFTAMMIGFHLTRAYGNERHAIFGALIGIASIFLLGAFQAGEAAGSYSTYLGARGMLIAMIASLTSVTIYNKLITWKKIQVNLPNGVPPSIAASFNQLFPIMITVGLYALIQPIWGMMAVNWMDPEYYYLINAIEEVIIAPFSDVVSSASMVFVISMLMALLFFFGIHGPAILAPILEGVWGQNSLENVAIFEFYGFDALDPTYIAEVAMPDGLVQVGDVVYDQMHVWTKSISDTLVLLGGTGATMGLIIGIKSFGRRHVLNDEIAKVSIAPGIFNINEPMIFGMPIMLNFIYALPFIFVQPLMSMVAYFSVDWGFLNPSVGIAPWNTPFFISGFLSTLDPMSFVVSGINFAIAILMYVPFVMLDLKVTKKSNPEIMDDSKPHGWFDGLYLRIKKGKEAREEKGKEVESKDLTVDFTTQSLAQLKSIASLKNIDVPAKATKEEIIAILEKEYNEKKKTVETKPAPAKKAVAAKSTPAAKKPAAKKPAAKKPAAKVDYSKMTVAQLKDVAKKNGVTIKSGAKKADIIATLEK